MLFCFSSQQEHEYLDDDENMCAFWHNHLKTFEMEVISFTQTSILIDWCLKNTEKLNHAIYLFDHQLHDPIWTGLALLEKFQLGKRSYLITSEIEEFSIQQYCSQLGTWLIPKFAIKDTSLEINNQLVFIN